MCSPISVSLSSTQLLYVLYMCIHCGHLTPSLSLPLPPHFSLSPPHHWQLGSLVREPSVWTGQRVYCTGRTHRRTQTSQTVLTTSHWAAAVCLAYIGDLTASYWSEKKCVFVCEYGEISVTGKVTACSCSFCLWSFV